MRYSISAFCLSLLLNVALFATPSAEAQQADHFTETAKELLTGKRHPDLKQGDLNAEQEVLQQIYSQRQFAPLWYDQEQPTAQALALLTILRSAGSYGLRAADYDGTSLTYQLNQQAVQSNLPAERRERLRAQFDVGLSTATLRFIKHLHYGRIDPRKAGFNLGANRGELDLAANLLALTSTQDAAATIAKLEPQFFHYQLLKTALARYRLLAVDEELTQLPAFKARSIKPGEMYEGAPALRRLLVAEQDLAKDAVAPDENTTLDAALVTGLQNYQRRHGLGADGALGKQTFAALTTPFARRVQQIELTLERWRWLPSLQSPMIVVNVPQFKLFAFNSADDREANLLRMDVIVGQTFPHTQTPIFLADMKYVVFRPYWDVPRDLLKREILPAIHKNPAYLQRNHMELVKGQGDNSPVVPATPENIAQLAAGNLRLRQQPGDDNALGEVKFMLPNSYNVYLHSTPAKQLFGESRRAFSHGCIRVSNPTALAQYVLRHAAEEWNEEQIKAALNGQPNQRVNLKQNIPVLIMYGTVMPNEAGQVQFFDDIYNYDAKLAKLL
ncbi:MAG: L,D-transpeptidase family protein [Steroidobacteraceae bacterium]